MLLICVLFCYIKKLDLWKYLKVMSNKLIFMTKKVKKLVKKMLLS
jgi:hypothetical protein